MRTFIQSIFKNYNIHPKQLFLVDGLGGVVSAFFLGIVLVIFKDYIGMPTNILIILALIACLFAVYSLSCFFSFPKNWKSFMRLIAIANSIYCLLTFVLLIFYNNEISVLGHSYFIIEILIILSIVAIEFTSILYFSEEK